MSDSEDDEDDALAGLSRPTLPVFAAGAGDDDDDDEEEESAEPAAAALTAQEEEEEEDEAAAFGGVSAEAAFDDATAPAGFELDPFRVAAGVEAPAAAAASNAAGKAGGGGPVSHKIFVGGLSQATTDDTLLKFFARYGKVQEARVISGRGFGFVSFVSQKGAKYCVQQAGDPPSVSIDGRTCAVRFAQDRDSRGAGIFKMPARGSVAYLGPPKKAGGGGGGGGSSFGHDDGDDLPAPGVAAIAAAQKRERTAPAGAGEGGADAEGGGGAKRGKKKKEIVTVSRRQDAEPLYNKSLTMKEIFPKEFWRI